MQAHLTAAAFRRGAAGAAALVVLLAAALLGAAPAPAAARPARAFAPDFNVVLAKLIHLRAHPPSDPLVVLLGGSSARECTVSDESWSDAVSHLVGEPVDAVNMGSKHRLFATDLRLIKLLPAEPAIVFIGVNMGRFCNGPYDPKVDVPETPAPSPTPSASITSLAAPATATRDLAIPASSHGSTNVMTDARKLQIAQQWMTKRWPHFQDRYRYNVEVLADAIRTSKALGQHPVIIDLPRNMDIIGHLLDRPLTMYHNACRRLAKKLGVPYVQFQYRTGLTNKDFSDLWHTVPSGKVKWQHELAATTAQLVEKYAATPAPTPSETATPQP